MIDRNVLAEYVKNHYTYCPDSGQVRRKGKERPVAGYTARGYLVLDISIDGQRECVRLHRIVFLLCHGRWPAQVDHIDGNPRNNRMENLREVTCADNLENRLWAWRPSATTGLPGVCKRSGGRYMITAGRNYYFADRYQAFVTLTLLGRMFREPEII